jgi:hypothetical protein
MSVHSTGQLAAQANAPVTPGTTVAVVIPMPGDPDWSIFDEIPADVRIIVPDDSDGKLAPPPRANVSYFDYTAQRDYMGDHYDAIPHKSAACRNFGHVVAFREGYDVIVALDYDCKVRPGWFQAHLDALTVKTDAPAVAPERPNGWVNSVTVEGWYARGYPYELRNPVDARTRETTATGEVKLHMGVWDGIVDLNGIDRFPPHDAPPDPGEHKEPLVALGNIPVCGMNTSFRRELAPAYFFLPDLWVDDGSPGGWQLSRHDDIWGGYIAKRLMDLRGDLLSFGPPVVEHTRLTPGTRTAKIEHYMHLLAWEFFALVDAASEKVHPDHYGEMFGALSEEFLSEVGRSRAPRHYLGIYRALGESMLRWAKVFA